MGITEKQRELRKKHLGSSDIAAIFGFDKYRNAYDVWADKTGKLDDKQQGSEAMYAGIVFEDGVLQFAEDKLGKLIRNQFRKAEGCPVGSNIDALVVETGEPVEAKTAGLFAPLIEVWGEDGSDEVPDRVILQSQTHLLCVDKELCYVPTFLGGRGFNLFRIKREDEIINQIMDKSNDFWDNFVLKDCPPPDIMPSMPIIQRMHREPDKTVDIDSTLVENWDKAKESRKLAEAIEEDAKEEMLAALGDAEAGRCAQGILTFLEQSRRYIDAKRLRDDKPDIAKEYEKLSTFRVPRIKKPKPAKI